MKLKDYAALMGPETEICYVLVKDDIEVLIDSKIEREELKISKEFRQKWIDELFDQISRRYSALDDLEYWANWTFEDVSADV